MPTSSPSRCGCHGSYISVARAWRELVMAMERAGAVTAGELGDELLGELAPKLWVVLPGR